MRISVKLAVEEVKIELESPMFVKMGRKRGQGRRKTSMQNVARGRKRM